MSLLAVILPCCVCHFDQLKANVSSASCKVGSWIVLLSMTTIFMPSLGEAAGGE